MFTSVNVGGGSRQKKVMVGVLTLLLLVACNAETDITTSTARSAVFYGVDEYGQEGTVMIDARGGSSCSGSVITPTVILTANHCVDGSEPRDWVVSTGWNAQRVSGVRIIEIVTPGPFTEDSEDDVALLIADSPIPAPIYPTIYELAPDIIDQPVTIVGYGYDELDFFGFRQSGTMWVKELTELTVVLRGTSFPGSGDSGGPVLDSEGRVIAVTSRGGTSVGLMARVDAHRWLIDPVMRLHGGCVPGDPELCDGFDNNCDLEIDEGCLTPGSPCENVELCTTQHCEAVEGTRICTLPCSLDDEEPCWDGAYCQETEHCGSGMCRPGEPGGRTTGEVCDDDLDCTSLLCRDPGDGTRRCTERCTPDLLECPQGQLCAELLESCGGCFLESIATWPRGLGEPCEEDSQCRSGRCLQESSRSYCSTDCGSSFCPETMYCRDEQCVLGEPGSIGARCEIDDDCIDELFCWTSNPEGLSVCTDSCNSRQTWCPGGSHCDFELSICVPDRAPLGALCDPEATNPCAQGDCIETSEGWLCSWPCSEGCPHGFVCELDVDGEQYCGLLEDAGETDGCGCNTPGNRGTKVLWWMSLFS